MVVQYITDHIEDEYIPSLLETRVDEECPWLRGSDRIATARSFFGILATSRVWGDSESLYALSYIFECAVEKMVSPIRCSMSPSHMQTLFGLSIVDITLDGITMIVSIRLSRTIMWVFLMHHSFTVLHRKCLMHARLLNYPRVDV